MAENDETNKKRKNTSTSNVSDQVDKEKDTRDNNIGKKTTQKKKKSKVGESIEEHNEEHIEITGCYKELQKEFQEINKHLNNLMKKDDSGIRIMMEDIVNEMKDELLKSVIGKIEIQEGCLLEKQ